MKTLGFVGLQHEEQWESSTGMQERAGGGDSDLGPIL